MKLTSDIKDLARLDLDSINSNIGAIRSFFMESVELGSTGGGSTGTATIYNFTGSTLFIRGIHGYIDCVGAGGVCNYEILFNADAGSGSDRMLLEDECADGVREQISLWFDIPLKINETGDIELDISGAISGFEAWVIGWTT